MSVRIERLAGANLAGGIDAVARLRMRVFRDWPYLYDGDLDYEATYLASFAQSSDAIIVAAFDVDQIIGAATGAPLTEHTEEFGTLFTDHGLNPETIFYCGESVLLSDYRGQGIGHAFFDHREWHARRLDTSDGKALRHSTFCGVVRAADDPRCPADYRPLDGFWEKRGYHKVPGLIGHYDWREIGDAEETRKEMQFWMREL